MMAGKDVVGRKREDDAETSEDSGMESNEE